jgi:hypothetical protein
MNVLSWLDFSDGPWTWRHYLFVSALALAVGAALFFWAMRRGKAVARSLWRFRAMSDSRWNHGSRRKSN